MHEKDLLEIQSLNAEDLDVEDLERRIELAAAVGADGVWCDVNCGTFTAPKDPAPVEV